jgi:polar amino acid transport system substrate-binding protein
VIDSPGSSAAASARTAASSSTLAKEKQQGYANVAVIDDPPFSALAANGKMSGIAPDLATAIFQKLGVKTLHPAVATYGSAIPGLLAGRWDMVASALDITAARCAQVIFSNPITADVFEFVYPKGNPNGITTIKDAVSKGLTLASTQGGLAISLVEAAGLPASDVQQYPDIATMAAALQAGRAQYTILDFYDAPKTLALLGSGWQASKPIPDAPPEVSAFAFRKSDVALRNAVNTQLTAMEKSGQFARIAKRSNFAPNLVKGKTTAAGCKAGI